MAGVKRSSIVPVCGLLLAFFCGRGTGRWIRLAIAEKLGAKSVVGGHRRTAAHARNGASAGDDRGGVLAARRGDGGHCAGGRRGKAAGLGAGL